MDTSPKANADNAVKSDNPSGKPTRALRDIIANAQRRRDQQPRKPRKPTAPSVRVIDERHH